MRINTFEAVGIGVSIAIMALALFLLRLDSSTLVLEDGEDQQAVVVESQRGDTGPLAEAIADASISGQVTKLIIDDIVEGDGELVEEGDAVTVHYIGMLQNGQQFDNSYSKNEPFTFTVGEGKVIDGWERGVVGMRVGGERILVVPSELAYGKEGYGPIPGNATLVYVIELLARE